jgi:uncharacterized OsmC-like protein
MEPSGVRVTYEGGDRLRVSVREHSVLTDQPVDGGGEDLGPTPTELLVGSLVSCMGFFAERFLKRNHFDTTGLELNATFTSSADRPFRVSEVQVEVTVPGGTPDRMLEPLRRVIDACTVHNTLRQEPDVRLTLERPEITRAAS